VEPSGEILHIKKIIVNASLLYEGALSIGEEVIHEGALTSFIVSAVDK
jgi:hypothetical protein